MARRTKEEAQATREDILDAAQACFHEYGVAGTSLAMIGTRAGYTRGAVYWHFRNKTEVLEAMIERERVPFVERLRRTTSPQRTTPVLDLRAALLASFAELASDARLRSMMEIMLRHDLSAESQAMQALQRACAREELEIFTEAFARAQTLGQLRAHASAETAALTLHICLSGVLYSAMLEPELFDLQRDAAEVLDVALAAYVRDGMLVPAA